MKLSPVFKPEDKPTRSGWYCVANSEYYAENERQLILYDLGNYIYLHRWFWYNTFWGKWFKYRGLCLPVFNQKQYWFGVLK